jgi:hypothetical protein
MMWLARALRERHSEERTKVREPITSGLALWHSSNSHIKQQYLEKKITPRVHVDPGSVFLRSRRPGSRMHTSSITLVRHQPVLEEERAEDVIGID